MSTYTQIHTHIIFSVRNRERKIDTEWRSRLYQYFITIIQNRGNKVLAIGGTDDHVHMLIGLKPTESIASVMMAVKRDSSKWINQNRLTVGRFEWQEGYGAFSCSKSHTDKTVKYILEQDIHHAKQSSADELKQILDKLQLEYSTQYFS